MRNHGLVRSFTAGAAIAPHRIVVFGADDDSVVPAAGGAKGLLGVSDPLGAAAGQRCDVVLTGIAEIEYGGPVERGDDLTADARGRAVATTDAQGRAVAAAGAAVIGQAMVSGVSGDIGSLLIDRGAGGVSAPAPASKPTPTS